jgi:signal transduction histidine kinase
MRCVSRRADERASPAGRDGHLADLAGRGNAAAGRAPALVGLGLALLALAELAVRIAAAPGTLGHLAAEQAGTSAGAVHSVLPSLAAPATAGVTGKSALVLGLVCLCTTLPLTFLRPAAAATAVTAATVLSLGLLDVLTVAGAAAQLIALYRAGRAGRQAMAVTLAAVFPLLAIVALAAGPAADSGGGTGGPSRILILVLASLAPAAAVAGIARRARGEAVVHSAARQVIADSLLEHTARGERARIARELHDVVAHHISMVAVQAETARLTTEGMPAAGAQRLLAIGDTARAALTEMRRLLGVLREDTEGDAVADRQPQPGLRQLNELLDEAREASGAGTRLIVSGSPAALDPGVELAAYRIVQEALTNARRHAPGAAVDVELHYADATLSLRIRDNGPGPAWPPAADGEGDGGLTADAAGPGGGHGLLGMRERAAAVGGELRTVAAPGGGFLVAASLPGASEDAR